MRIRFLAPCHSLLALRAKALLTGLCLLLSGQHAQAEPLPPEGPAARLIEAHRLADLGARARDPVLLVAAARLMQGLALRMGGPADWTEGAKAPGTGSADLQDSATVPDPAKAPPLPGSLDPAALYEAARGMAAPDSAMRDAISEAEAEIPPPAQGLALTRISLEGDHLLSLPGGDPVQIGLLTLAGRFSYRLTGPDGKVLCEDASASPARLCTLTLPDSQTLTLTTAGAADFLLATP